MKARRWPVVAAAVGALALAVAAAGTSQGNAVPLASPSAAGGSGAYRVGIVYSRTGPLAAYGAQYIQGLRYGLSYATKGTNRVNGRRIQLTVVDDQTDAAKAVSAAKDLIGQGYKVLAGSVSSGVALQMAPLAEQNRVLFISGPAATDGVTGANRYTFRSGRQSYQDVRTAELFLGNRVGRKIVVFAQDTAFGASNVASVTAVLGGRGHTVQKILVPPSATEFTPYAQQARQANPDLLFVAWAGTTAPAMWRALDQQNAFARAGSVVTGLDLRSSYPLFGGVEAKIRFLSHYVYIAPKNKVNDFLVRAMRRRNQVPDLFHPDGFNAGIMIVRALQRGNYNVDRMIRALEGWSFVGPKGQSRIRQADHALIQPMFHVRLGKRGTRWAPVVLRRLQPAQTQPPVRTS